MTYPLSGLKVIDMSRVLAGPFAGRMLADLGADVVKIEPPEGDVTRLWGKVISGVSGYFHQQNVSKRGMCIDLSGDRGAALVKRLTAGADILIENFRPGVMNRLGLGFDTLSAVKPDLIMLSISGFGQDSPESRRAAYAPVVHAELGFLHRQAEDAGAYPVDLTLSVADTNASLHGLVAVLSALHLRTKTGVGQHIDMAMVDASVVTDDRLHYQLEASHARRPQGNEVWDTAGGQMILAGDLRFLWKQLTDHFDVPDPSPEGATLDDKIRCRHEALQQFLKETCRDRDAVIAALAKMNVAWGDVRTSRTLREQPTVRHRQSVIDVTDAEGNERPVTASPYRFSAARAGVQSPAPRKGEHNAAVLEDWLGMTAAEVDDWRDVLVTDGNDA